MSELGRFYELLDAEGVWSRTVNLRRGEPLLLPGHRDRNLYYVQEGILVATVEIAGAEQCMRFAYSDDIVTALDTHLNGQPSSFAFRALRKTRLRVADYRAYQEILLTNAQVRELWQRLSEGLLLGLMEREIDLLTPSPEERYRRVLERSPRLFQEVPAKYIANYLRMTPETLSRIRKVDR